jgi:hypothetical protein
MHAVREDGGEGRDFPGTRTRLMRPALSVMEVAPVINAPTKKLKGTRPQSTKTGNGLLTEFP